MNMVLSSQGEVITLKAVVNQSQGEDLLLKLFKNDVVPVKGYTENNYLECTFSGYEPILLNGSGWAISEGSPSAGTPSVAAYPNQNFHSDADQEPEYAYGFYIVQQYSGKLVWAYRFEDKDAPYKIFVNGQIINVAPRIVSYSKDN